MSMHGSLVYCGVHVTDIHVANSDASPSLSALGWRQAKRVIYNHVVVQLLKVNQLVKYREGMLVLLEFEELLSILSVSCAQQKHSGGYIVPLRLVSGMVVIGMYVA
jgi:hypothetical protein